MRLFGIILALCLTVSFVAAQQFYAPLEDFSTSDETPVEQYYSFHINWDQAEMDLLPLSGNRTGSIILPDEQGNAVTYSVEDAPILPEKIRDRYPEIRTYKIRSQSNQKIYSGRISITPAGMHGLIHSNKGVLFIQPSTESRNQHRVFFTHNADLPVEEMTCGLDRNIIEAHPQPDSNIVAQARGLIPMRKYKLALAATGEYTQHEGGTVASALAHMTMTVNAMNQIYENDVAITFEFVDDIESLIFTNPNNDPYPTNEADDIFDRNTNVLNSILGYNNYGVGHVFGYNCLSSGLAFPVAGISGFRIACNSTNRGRGISCIFSSDLAFILTTAHEFGHHYSASHTWNQCSESTSGARVANNAFEPGAGRTIMSYAGSCDLNNTGARQEYFHVASLQQIIQYSRSSTGNTCPIYINNGNSEPIASVPIGDDLVIPIRTPFELTGTAFDSNGDEMTYTWEQYNAGPEAPIGEVIDDGPAFISMNPSDSPTRIFPDLNQVLNSTYNDPHEIIPDYTRDYRFRFTVRDNNPGGGGTDWQQIEITSHAAAGPFYISKPHFPEDWAIGDTVEVTWNVANTNITALVNCKEVDIFLSLDGGKTFPITLKSGTSNDGSEMVIVPDAKTSQARVKIKGSGHIFFDISNFNFKIIEPPVPGFTLSIPEANATGCLPEPLVLDISVASVLGYDSPVSFTIIDTLPSGVTATIDADQVIPGNSTTLTIVFDDTVSEGYHEFRVRAIADNADTLTRLIRLTIVSNEFNQITLQHPFNGENNITVQGNLQWRSDENAEYYDVVLGTNPALEDGDVFFDDRTADTSIMTPTLSSSTPYYWSIRPVNDCGPHDWKPAWSFHTDGNVVGNLELVVNDTLFLPSGSVAFIGSAFLKCIDAAHNDDQIIYTVSSLPTNGSIQLNGVDILIGTTFSQQDLNNGLLVYGHNNDDSTIDSFRFDIDNGEGGWIGNEQFIFAIDDNSVSINDITNLNTAIYPNPSSGIFTLQSDDLKGQRFEANILSIDGRMVYQVRFSDFSGKEKITASDLKPGIYFLQIRTATGVQSMKIGVFSR